MTFKPPSRLGRSLWQPAGFKPGSSVGPRRAFPLAAESIAPTLTPERSCGQAQAAGPGLGHWQPEPEPRSDSGASNFKLGALTEVPSILH